MKSDNLKKAIDYLKYIGKIVNNKDAAKMMGASEGSISRHLKGTPEPPDRFLRRLNQAFNGIFNEVWLLTGEGPMLVTSEVTPMVPAELTPYTTTKNGTEFQERPDGKIVMQVPIVTIAALGSPEDEYATLIEDGTWETMPFIVDGVHHGKYFAFRIEGDSMDNGTYDGFRRKDIILVRELARDKWLPRLHYTQWPYWVIVWGNNVRIKQIIGQDDRGNITLHSLNPSPEYTDFTLCLDQVSRLFNVIQHIPHPNVF